MNILSELKLLVMVGEFVWHALVSYAGTTQGTAELQAIEQEWQSQETANPTPTDSGASGVAARVSAARKAAGA